MGAGLCPVSHWLVRDGHLGLRVAASDAQQMSENSNV